MPRIPDFNVPSVQVQPIQMPEMQGPGVAPMPNAAPQQIQEMGQGMSRFGQGMSDIAMRMQDMVNDSVVAETDNKWRNILNQESVRFQSLQGRDAITGYNSFQENLAKQRREIEAGLTNPAQKIAFRGAADRRMMDVDRQANFHVMREAYNFKVKETEARINNMAEDAISFGSRVYDPGTPLSVKLLDGTGAISDKTAAAITMGAKQDNLDAFQTRFSGLMNQAREHLSFQGINPDDEQGKLYMKNLERGVYTGVLQRMVQDNDVDSARFFLADNNNRSKVDPKLLYDVETTLAKERKSQMSENIARAVFMRDDLPTVEDKKNFVMGAFTAGHIDQSDLKATFATIESLAKDEDESFKKRQNQALDLAKTKIRTATQGLGFPTGLSAGNALLGMDKNLYMQLGEDGITKLEDWARTNYQERTNPAHRNQLLDMMQNNPEVFAGLTETELRYSYQLSKEDEDWFIASIKDKNNTATPAQKQILSDKELMYQQFRKEHPSWSSRSNTMLQTNTEFVKWHDNIQVAWSQFATSPENKNATLFDYFQTRDKTQVVKDGKIAPLSSLPFGETGTFRVQVPNTDRTVDVLPGDIPDWERNQVVTAIQNANQNLYRVYKLEQDENGVQKLVLHTRANGEAAMHRQVSDAMAEAQSLGEGFTVQKADLVPEDEQSIATQWVRSIAKKGEDVDQYVGRVRRRADLGEKLKTQGAASFEEFMQRFVDNPEMSVFIPDLVDQLNIADDINRIPGLRESIAEKTREGDRYKQNKAGNVVADADALRFYKAYGEPIGLRKRTSDAGAKYDLKEIKYSESQLENFAKNGIPQNDLIAQRFFGLIETSGPLWTDIGGKQRYKEKYQTMKGIDAFDVLNQVANSIGLEVSPELVERHRQLSLNDNNYPAATASVQASAQLSAVTSEQRKQMAAEVRSATWRKGSYEWHLANTPIDALRSFVGPFRSDEAYKPKGATVPTRDAVPPSPIGVSLIDELRKEIAAEQINLQIQKMAKPDKFPSSPRQQYSSPTIEELERMIEQVNSGDYSAAEQWRAKKDTIEKAYKSVFPNGLPK